ncbi:hypothetical protein RHGRI_012566 [Rhododendron griersonianum]|uniref:Helicase ATP-binding domain-containing protein n=1 Tax=Rhododendron griersonianum TaxID=479676 RepID=A0AAV6KRE5_9ERIC|nr:hypothetical protein RHGRI_012566 [Rhododendron griersonianum]
MIIHYHIPTMMLLPWEQVLVLDEADCILDGGFKKALNAIVSQLPKHRQTFLFSATQMKLVQDLARLSLKDPEYLSVHEESIRFVFEAFNKHPLEMSSWKDEAGDSLFQFVAASKRYANLREELKEEDKEDKLLDRQRGKEKQMKEKGTEGSMRMILRVRRIFLGQMENRTNKRSKKYFDSDSDDAERVRETMPTLFL